MKRKADRLPQTIDEYLAPLSDEKRAALEKLRMDIKSAVPKAEESISYQIPAFRLPEGCLWALARPRTTAPSTRVLCLWKPTKANSRPTTQARAPSVFWRTVPYRPHWCGGW